MRVSLDIFNTPEGRRLTGDIDLPLIATLDWLDKNVLSFWVRASRQNGLLSLREPFDEPEKYEGEYSWNRNGLGLELKQNPQAAASPYFCGESPRLLVQIVLKKDSPPPIPEPVLPQANVDDYIFVEYEPGKYDAYDEDGKEHMVLVAHDMKLLEMFKRSNHGYDGYFTEPFLGVICTQSRAELEEELAEREAWSQKEARHCCQRPKWGGEIVENVKGMAANFPYVYVTLAGFYQCVMHECLPYDESWLCGARLIDFDKILIPMLNYRTILGFFVIDVEGKELSVYRTANTGRTIIDAHRRDIFTLMLRFIAGEMALVNPLTAFRADSWRQEEYTIQGGDKLEFYRAVHDVLHVVPFLSLYLYI